MDQRRRAREPLEICASTCRRGLASRWGTSTLDQPLGPICHPLVMPAIMLRFPQKLPRRTCRLLGHRLMPWRYLPGPTRSHITRSMGAVVAVILDTPWVTTPARIYSLARPSRRRWVLLVLMQLSERAVRTLLITLAMRRRGGGIHWPVQMG